MQTHSTLIRSTNSSSSSAKRLLCGIALAMFAMAGNASAQSFLVLGGPVEKVETCKGRVRQVIDATNESVLTTKVQYGTGAGGGEGGQFDPAPILTIPGVKLLAGACINAHVSAIVGSTYTYGTSTETLFQLAMTPVGGGGPMAMEGHYATPYGINSPAVAEAAEPDVDMFAANFFQSTDNDWFAPGAYNVSLFWAGAPNAGGAIGAAFVIKLYVYGQ